MADIVHAGRRLGRPREADSAATKRRILDVARASFASGGYDSSTNRGLAAQVGITPGALYYYYPSKLDLYLAVHDDVQQRVYGKFNEAVDDAERFLDAFDSVLDVAHDLNEADPTVAAFIGATRADMRRHPEIAASLAGHTERRNAFFERLIDAGVLSGEIDPENRAFMVAFVSIILIGLTDGVSDDSERHQRAVTSIKMALRGDLLTPVPN
jgi:AcrR family transcriptional regulator